MAALAAALIVFVLCAQASAVAAATWGALTAAVILGAAVLIIAARTATAEARRAAGRYASLLNTVAAGQNDLQDTVVALERGMRVPLPQFTLQPPAETDSVGRLAHAVARAQFEAKAAIVRSAQLAQGVTPGSEERVEVFVNLARRLQSLIHRQITMLDRLENEVEDPELLKGLFSVDHLATRIRRHAENVAVLGGSVSRRQWTRPVSLMEVLRSSIAEVEQYPRVMLVPPIEGTLRGHAVADVVHLLAELVENATSFSDPDSQVLLRAQRVTAGLAVEVDDRGLGILPEELARLNALLSQPDRIDLAKLLADGRIGLYVVSELARRHSIVVRLQSNIYGGIQAVLILPHTLIGDESDQAPSQAAAEVPQPAQHALSQHPPVPAEPVGRYVPQAQDTTQPVPRPQPMPQMQRQRMDAPAHTPPHHTPQPTAAVRPAAPQAPGRLNGDSRTGKPQLPQRRAQEHLAPELKEAPTTRMSGGTPQGEHDPGLMAAFQRGHRLAEEVSADTPADDSR